MPVASAAPEISFQLCTCTYTTVLYIVNLERFVVP